MTCNPSPRVLSLMAKLGGKRRGATCWRKRGGGGGWHCLPLSISNQELSSNVRRSAIREPAVMPIFLIAILQSTRCHPSCPALSPHPSFFTSMQPKTPERDVFLFRGGPHGGPVVSVSVSHTKKARLSFWRGTSRSELASLRAGVTYNPRKLNQKNLI